MHIRIRSILTNSFFVALAGLALAGCETTTQAGAVGIERKQLLMISSQQMDESARQTYAKMMAQEKAKGALNRNQAQVNRVREISNRLIAQTGVFRAEARQWQWEVNVVTSNEVNAWCMPGGKIAVYTGLIDRLQTTDDELAAVIGHEIAHALREHARERASQQTVASAGISILAAAAGLGDTAQKGMEFAYMGAIGLPNSRAHETESDRIGVELAARAGYDPRAAISLWQKMGRISGGNGQLTFLSTHPSHADRIGDLTAYAARVMPLYEQARRR